MLVVFDIDGTLANIEHRLHYIKQHPKNWAAFDAGISHDRVNKPVAAMFFALRREGYDVIFASGRNERTRSATMSWLEANSFWHYGTMLYMRKTDDFRSDDIVKQEILDRIVADYGKLPDMWFDDRPRVVRAVRKRGIFVFNVYQGEEDF